jgi:hypothetical protein
MSQDILFNFGMRSLDRARKTADDIAKKVKEAARAIKDVSVRKKFVAKQKEIAGERQEEIDAQASIIDRRNRSRAQEVAPGSIFNRSRNAQLAGRVFSEGREVIGEVAAGNISGLTAKGARLFAQVPGFAALGPAAAIGVAVWHYVREEVDTYLLRERNARAAEVKSLVEDAIEKADLPGRLKRDPFFRRQQERLVASAFFEEAVQGWHPATAPLLDIE